MKNLWPDWYFDSYTNIPEGFFKKHNIKYLISDIDNTLVSYGDRVPTEKALKFFHRLEKEGVTLLLASNNSKKRVATFVGDRRISFVYRAGKPSVTRILIMLHKEKIHAKECAFLGDQIFTDCLAAKRMGMPMILLKPITNDRALPLFGIRRDLERIILKKYLKNYPLNCEMGRRYVAEDNE